MKLKLDFVTNSSSTAFLITNKSDKELNLTDFVMENQQLVDEFIDEYSYEGDPRFEPALVLESAAANNVTFPPRQTIRCVFGDESGTIIGMLYDYALREGGQSKNFIWRFHEFLR